ncbi:leucyl aminopeptidase [Piscirickettsia litoralis]|uniref:Probable cytosol aminopeptidase n=1 Tax=Piscirickettsia litoralis TaxID=1891921 RepID=A0ABX3A2U8_9GAMM|nr:leucyl aminopeptidase [Piscirickettsia litoralis]ODN41948.1 leucyl aminopeptidase [Piscirickettsia litoralis]
MKFSSIQSEAYTIKSDCLVVTIFEGKEFSETATAIDQATDGLISRLIERGDISGKSGQSLLIPEVSGINAERVLLIGAGKKDKLTDLQFKSLHEKAIARLKDLTLNQVTFSTLELPISNNPSADKLSLAMQAIDASYYRVDGLKSKPKEQHVPAEFNFIGQVSEADLDHANALLAGIHLTKDLANAPGNVCTPSYFAKTAQDLAQDYTRITTQIIDEEEGYELGFNSFLAVGQGSEEPSKFIIMHYQGADDKDEAPIGFVGKGISFDSGGVSIKPGEGMEGMKYDMCGAASVFGVMKAAAEMNFKKNIVGIVVAAENMPDGKALKPGDILTSYSGQTIEVINTDAEGRLALCDGLSYIEKFKPQAVIDIATLTGACVVALGEHNTGLMSNDDDFAQTLLKAGKEAADKAWQLPLDEEYQAQIDSPFADMANVGGKAAGTITAACFLSRFTKNYTWAHLDIAGSAGGVFDKKKGATARPVPLLMRYLSTLS